MNIASGFGVYKLFCQTFNHGSNRSGMNSFNNFDSSSSSSSESEEENTKCEVSKEENQEESGSLCFDNIRFRSDLEVVTLHKVETIIEPMLGISELISLVFLLYDCKTALQFILVLIAAGPEDFVNDKISNWARTKPKNWEATLLEALAIIQNYQILKKLGCNKQEIKTRFLSYENITLNVSRVKKMLYKMMECLTKQDSKKVGALFEFNEKFQPISDRDYKYMEFHILLWADKGFITIDENRLNLDKLIQSLDLIDTPLIKNLVSQFKNLVVENTSSAVLRSEFKSSVEDISCIYSISNPNDVGLMIVINNVNFYWESNLNYEVGTKD